MKFILEEHEYKEIQQCKQLYENLLQKSTQTKEEYLEEFFNNQKGDTIIKIESSLGGKKSFSYVVVDSNDPRFYKKFIKNKDAEITKTN